MSQGSETPVLTLEQTTEFLWDYIYQVRLPQLALLTEDEIRYQGIPSSGDKSVDRVLTNQLITTFISPVKMVKFHADGYPVRIVRANESKIIYDHIQAHLGHWARSLGKSLNLNNAPLDELLAMNKFAQTLFEGVRDHLTVQEEQTSSFMRYIDGFNFTRNRARIQNAGDIARERQEAVRPDYEELFRQSSVGGNRPWNS